MSDTAPGHFGPPPDDLAPPHGNDDIDDDFIVEIDRLFVGQRLTLAQKLRRSGLITLTIAVAAFLLLGGPSTFGSLLGNLRMSLGQPVAHAKAIPRMNNVSAEEITLARRVGSGLAINFGPANGPDGLIYGCWIEAQADHQTVTRQLHVATWTRANHNWIDAPTPLVSSLGCAIVPDRERESGVLLVAWPPHDTVTSGCILPHLFHSDDAAQHWTPIPWPTDIQPTCSPTFFLADGRLYVQSPTAMLPANILQLTSTAGLLLATNTASILWQSVDAKLASELSFQLVTLRPGGRLLAEALQSTAQGQQVGSLWQSTDAGQSWALRALLPGNMPAVFASSDPQAVDHGGWGYLYVTYLLAAAGSAQPTVAYGALTASQPIWKTLPLPESASTRPGKPLGNILLDGSEGPLESLIYLRPQDTFGRPLSPLYFPWFWDVNHNKWVLDSIYLSANSIPQGISWYDGTMTIIFSVIHQGVEPFLQTFSSTITPNAVLTAG